MQQVVSDTKKLFNEKGEVVFGGWSKSPLFEYNKGQYQTPNKLCEKDCYYITNKEMGFYLSVETQGFEMLIKIIFVNYRNGRVSQDYISKKFMLSPTKLPEAGNSGEFSYTDKKIALTLTNTVDGRYIKCDFIDFANYKNLYVKVLVKKLQGESMNIIAPFEKSKKNFYFKRFVPKFTAKGVVSFGGTEYNLDEENSYVYFDWSRYSLPRHQKYQVLNGIFTIGGHTVAINLASRVGDNKKGNENCFFVDNYLFKIGKIKVGGDEKRYDKEWFFKADNGSLDLTFTPKNNSGALLSCKCEKDVVVFGNLNGYIVDENIGTVKFKNKPVHMIFTTL